MKHPKLTIAVIVALAIIAVVGWGARSGHVAVPGFQQPLKSVNLGPDIEVDVGGTACSFSGYVWACESCTVPPISVPKPNYEGTPTSVEIIAPDGSSIDTTTSTSDIIINLEPVTPEVPGCADFPHLFEVRAMDDSNILMSDTMSITVRCCGV